MSKIYILDTNVLLHDPKSLTAFADNEVVIPLVVLDELDKKKVGQDEVARNARMAIRTLDQMRELGSIHKGVKTTQGGLVRVELNHREFIPQDLDPSRADNRIISVALGLMKDHPRRKVTIVTKDINLRVKCDALEVYAEDYDTDSVADDANAIFSGFSEIVTTTEMIDNLYKDGFVDASELGSFQPNEYALLRSGVQKHSALVKLQGTNFVKIRPSTSVWGISPRNKEQAFAMDALFDPNIKLVTMIGRAGSGKTLLAAAAGISQIMDSHTYRKLILTRPIQPLGRDIGFLPGDIDDKMKPWMAPLQDNLELLFSEKGKHYIDMLKESDQIEIEALTYIRGRSIPRSFIIVDECQNLTLHEAKTILTRIGEGSKVILTGDILQIDNPYIDSVDNGLSCVVEKFKGSALAAHITLVKGERSELATLAAEIL